MSGFTLEFEKPIVELEKKIQELKDYSVNKNIGVDDEIHRLEDKVEQLKREIFSKLTRWQRVQVARHPKRPYTLDYIERIFTDFVECHGDRAFQDDPAIIAGIAKLNGQGVVIVGHQKGRDTKQKLYRNFGMPHPEGYRKAMRLMQLAAKFNKPIISLVDTPGAYPGIGAEERGQAEAIAHNLREMSRLPVPIIIVIIGEGASGGALGIGVGDRILMLENTWYSVISPEGCAAILWRDSSKADLAAEAMKVAPKDLFEMKVVDEIIPEPAGGAHTDYDSAARILKERLLRHLKELHLLTTKQLLEQRLEKFSRMGTWLE
ncbi:acetyl-CoA carboxylase carboxyltransferase subunit alpha [candidate division KSB1 bacterium]|nr:acetyl-CoA carboxylase carboxyltransferase subunit alpha [candidate division KSB1 bacterium]